MKKLKPLLFLCLLSLFAACKKDNVTISNQKPDPDESVSDSAAYTVDGKTYSANSAGYMAVGNSDPSLRIDSVVNHANYISGNKDSVFFWRTYGVSNFQNRAYIEVSFFKTYSKREMNKDAFNNYIPNNRADLLKPGKYDFQVDYNRVNAHNGVAIKLLDIGESYSYKSIAEITKIKQESEKGSYLEITKFKTLKNGYNLLEAKFEAVVFDSDENPHKVTNGYLRITIP